MKNLSNLIEALKIFLKYGDYEYPIHCEHDTLFILEINPYIVSDEDKDILEQLGFYVDESEDVFFYYT